MSESTTESKPYEAPQLLLLGSVDQLTLGNTGSVMDQSGRASHGKIKP
jgi:hypothetical protein